MQDLSLKLLLILFPPTPEQLYRLQGRNGHTVKVIETAAGSWQKLAYSLHIAEARVGIIEKESPQDPEKGCEKALCYWMNAATHKPVVWGTLVQALRDADLNTLATDIEEVLKDKNK